MGEKNDLGYYIGCNNSSRNTLIRNLRFVRFSIGRNEQSQFHKKITNCDHNFTTQHNFVLEGGHNFTTQHNFVFVRGHNFTTQHNFFFKPILQL